MVLAPDKLTLALAGTVLVAVALVGMTGLVPALSGVCPPGATCTVKTIVADFEYASLGGMNASVTDHSGVVIADHFELGVDISHISLNWGDGTPVVSLAPLASASHTYARAANYSLTETVYGNFAGGGPVVNESKLTTIYPLRDFSAGGGGSAAYTLAPKFTASVGVAAVSLLDESTATNVTSLQIGVNWGDGATSGVSLTGSADHSYTAPASGATSANYTLTLTLSGYVPSGAFVTEAAQSVVTVSFVMPGNNSTSGPCGSAGAPACPSPPPPPPPPSSLASALSLNALTGALLLGGFALIVAAFLPVAVDVRLLTVLAGFAAGAALGFAVGGLGPL